MDFCGIRYKVSLKNTTLKMELVVITIHPILDTSRETIEEDGLGFTDKVPSQGKET